MSETAALASGVAHIKKTSGDGDMVWGDGVGERDPVPSGASLVLGQWWCLQDEPCRVRLSVLRMGEVEGSERCLVLV